MNMMLNIVKGRHRSVKTQTYYYLRLMLQKLPYKCLHESKTEKKPFPWCYCFNCHPLHQSITL